MTAAAAHFTTSRHAIGLGQAGGLDTVHRMRQIAAEESAAALVRTTATAIARDTGTNSEVQIALLRLWLERHVAFLRDPYGTELLQTPAAMLVQLGTNGYVAGDCDDVATLAAALGMAIGLRARYMLIGRGQAYEHVWTELSDPMRDEWHELDITRPYQVDFSRYDLSLAIEV